MPTPVDYLPIVTTVIAAAFATVVLRRWTEKGFPPHLGWWGFGMVIYGIGTLTESSTTLFGWDPFVFKAWYVFGALLGGAPLAQGTAYLLVRRRRAHALAACLVAYVLVAAVLVILSPIDMSQVEPYELSGAALSWSWVRLLSPAVNTYAVVFLVGGAALSAWRFRKDVATRGRMVGNILIAVGAILPGIGGAFSRAGYTRVLYVGELVGLVLIYFGYWFNVRAGGPEGSALPGPTRPAPA